MVILRKAIGGIVLGGIGIIILIYNPLYFFSAWAFILFLGTLFLPNKLLNIGVYGVLTTIAICITKATIGALPLVALFLGCIVISIARLPRSTKKK